MENPQSSVQVYTKYGQIAEKAQVLETEVGNVVLAFFALFVGTKDLSEEKKGFYSHLLKEVNRQTLGRLLSHIKTIVEFDAKTFEIVDTALEKRNYFTHHFFRTHNFAIYSEAGRSELLRELTAIGEHFDLAHTCLSAITGLLMKISGIASPDPSAMIGNAKRQKF